MNMASPDHTSSRERVEHYAALEFILLGDLRDLLEEPFDDTTRRWMLAVLETLLETLPKRFALQEQGGFCDEVLEHYPSWYRHVEELQQEQRGVFAKLSHLLERLQMEDYVSGKADEICHDLKEWMARLTAYHRHERRLVQTAFNLEIGGGD